MAIGTEEKPKVPVETAETGQVKRTEMNALQRWVSSLNSPWGELVAVGFTVVPIIVVAVLLAIMGR